ncbi:MAG: PIN domain-containing protein [Hoeflea sp.]|uniref:PIN domain-containing protein n=1 Tax=Hoeflea sp. TaxID=1940281 RepID=UPI002731C3F0|nr:PIN domain-containing protein [Hoeflea sp.]MDP2122266.1 PIN domain-containing protein [Hoeflea sp.]
MIGIDTNILVRFLVEDESDQRLTARRWLGSRNADDPAYVSAIVVAETVWVLNRRLKYPMTDVTRILRDLLASDGLVIEMTEELDALLRAGEPAADIADYFVAWTSAKAGCSHTVTFDKLASKQVPGMEFLS